MKRSAISVEEVHGGPANKAAPLHRAFMFLQLFFTSWRFPAFVLSCILWFNLLLVAILLMPVSDDALGAFAREFKIWCFRYDPQSGGMDWAYVMTTFLGPVLLAAMVMTFWGGALFRKLRQRPKALVPYSAASFVLLAPVGGFLATVQPSAQFEGLAFPARSLRTSIPAPSFRLTDQNGKQVSLKDFKGRVVLLTGVYSACHFT